jgi:hypothetical protein
MERFLKRYHAVPATAMLAGVFLIGGACFSVEAQKHSETMRGQYVAARPAGVPVMAVVALSNQRVTIYDADGKLLRGPVSTGRTGYETPAGIFSVLEKKREHYSNLYDDAEMPFMQRITWSGIALHAGPLPGYPASHGCIRLPHGFAENLFELTRTGMRVVVVRDDISPVEVAHPGLFRPGPIRSEVAMAAPAGDRPSMHLGMGQTWRAIATARKQLADAATREAEEARQAVAKVAPEAGRLAKKLRVAEGAKLQAETQMAHAERMLETAAGQGETQRAEKTKAKALQRLTDAQTELDAIRAEAQPRIDTATAAREAAKTAEAAREAAVSAAKSAEVKLQPASVFVSRKTQRLYVRQAFQPMFDSPVTIKDSETPIGTTIFTAVDYKGENAADLRWSALAMYPHASHRGPAGKPALRRDTGHRPAEPASTDVAVVKAALERIAIPPETIDRISEVMSPGSSLIISDEGLSGETGKGTDFIVLMSGEPQGAMNIRRRSPPIGYGRTFRRSPYGMNPYSWW